MYNLSLGESMPGLASGWEKPPCIHFPAVLCNARHPFRMIEGMPLQPPFCANSFRMRSYKHTQKGLFLSPLECAVTSTLSHNSFRMRSYKKGGEGGYLRFNKILRSLP